MQSIRRRDVIELLDAIVDGGTEVKGSDGKRHQLAGGPISANRTLSAIRVFFNWALRRGIVEVNPCAQVERPGQEEKRERTLAAEEVRTLWPQFEALGYPFGPFFKLTLVTGQRRGEVAGMRWADIDLEEKTWTLSADATKAGRGHVVPLSPLAVRILGAVPRKAGSPYVFTTEGKTPISGFSRAKARIETVIAKQRKAAKLDPLPQWGVHDLRRTAATEMGRLGVARFIVSKVLNHSDRTVTGVYDRHEYVPEKRAALEAWASYLEGLVRPEVVAVQEAAE